MKEASDQTVRFVMILPSLMRRLAYLTLFVGMVGVILLDKTDHRAVEGVRTHVTDLVIPVMDRLARPVAFVSATMQRAGSWLDIREENRRLRQENAQLRQWRNAAAVLSTENAAMRRILNFVPETGLIAVTARVVGESGGPYVRSVLINAGNRDGISKGDPVVSGDGLVGRITEVGSRSARVILITDLSSRIPVSGGPDRVRAILAGDNGVLPELVLLNHASFLDQGDAVVTSGLGDVFPSGLHVGRVVSGRNGAVRVRPFADLDRLEHVRVITSFPAKEATNADRPSG